MSQDSSTTAPEQVDLPSVDQIHLLSMPELVLFPGLFMPLHVEDPDLLRTIDAAFHHGERRLAVVRVSPCDSSRISRALTKA